MNFIKKNWCRFALLFYAFVVPISVLYADVSTSQGKIVNPLGPGNDNITSFIKTFLDGVITIGIPVVALAVIYCGFLFVQARGKPDEITKAKDALLYTLIGAAILLGSWAIAQLISDTVLAL